MVDTATGTPTNPSGAPDPTAGAYAHLPLPEALQRFSGDIATLVRSEIALVRGEISAVVPSIVRSAGLLGAAAALGVGALLAVTIFLVALLALWLPVWAAALIVTVVYLAGAGLAALRVKTDLAAVTRPIPRVADGLKKDVEAVTTGFGRGR